MPIYEFYCKRCNTLFNFFSKTVNTDKIPKCPRCKTARLTRRMSMFSAITGSAKEADGDDSFAGMDEAKIEKAMMQLAAQAEHIRDDDPRAAAALMRKLSETTGMTLGDGMQEALERLAKGEDPDKIDAEMGDLLSEDDLFKRKRSGKMKKKAPTIDETLYDL
ncbi:MAG TPA: zinc ribbon domain-containing protein [Smithellaceae bacterium]|nr:zinc ribbon domain-containing protein [Smithellaceae bacterium]